MLPKSKLLISLFFLSSHLCADIIFVPITRKELSKLNYTRGDAFLEVLQNNPEFQKNRLLQSRDLEPTSENLDKIEEIVSKERIKQQQKEAQRKSLFDYSFEELIHEYKYPLIATGTVFSMYSYLLFKLNRAKNYVNKTTTWASFYKNVPLESLYDISQEKFLADLEVVIYRTFSEDEDKPNYQDTEPLYLFVKAAQKEIKRLETFVNLYWYCKLPIVSFLFPDYDDELILAQEKIECLIYMLELVTKKLYELYT